MTTGRIIFVNRVYWPDTTATAQLLTDLAEGLARSGHDVHVVCAGCGPAEQGGVKIHRTGGATAHRGLVSQAANYLRFLVDARSRLRTLAGPGDIVVVKTDPPLLAVAVSGLARARSAQVVQWIQDIYPEILPLHAGAWLRWPLAPLRWLRDAAWRASAACVVVGEDMRPTVERSGVARERIHVLPNWAPRECEEPAADASIAAQRAEWGIGRRFLVCYSGNLGRVHEFDTLVDAARRLRDDDGIVFAFIGGGPRLAQVRAQVAALGLAHVLFLPPAPRARLAAALGAADVHVVTLRPGFEQVVNPSKLAGILSSGRPVVWIGPAPSANTRLIQGAGCGRVFAPGAGEAVAHALRDLRSQSTSTAAGRAARALFERQFSFAAQLDRWQLLLQSVGHPTRR